MGLKLCSTLDFISQISRPLPERVAYLIAFVATETVWFCCERNYYESGVSIDTAGEEGFLAAITRGFIG
jgi:hypothetical protein